MRKKSCRYLLLVLVFAMLYTAGCGNRSVETEEETEVIATPETEEKEEEAESFVEFETVHSDDDYYVSKLIESEDVSRDSILAVSTAAYEGADKYSSFIFTGQKDEELGAYIGQLWFVNDSGAVGIEDAGDAFYSIDNILTFDDSDKAFFYANEYYATEAVSRVYGVRDGRYYEERISRIGTLVPGEANDFTITVGAYDNSFSSMDGLTLGHTWKPYYFFYDEKKGGFGEYYGSLLSTESLTDKYGIDISAEIEAIGGTVLSSYERDNGIITVNYCTRELFDDGSYSITYSNANYDVNLHEYIDAWGNGTHSLQDSDYGGEYAAAICPKLMYAENISDDELYDLFIAGKVMDSEGQYFDYSSFGDSDEGMLECRKLDIDEDGTNELIPVVYGSYTYSIYTIRNGYIVRYGIEDCIWGSEGGFFNNKHQYVGTDCSHANRNQYLISEYTPEQGMKVVLFFAKWWEDDANTENAQYVKYEGDGYWDTEWDDYQIIDEAEYQKLLNEYTKELRG